MVSVRSIRWFRPIDDLHDDSGAYKMIFVVLHISIPVPAYNAQVRVALPEVYLPIWYDNNSVPLSHL